MLKGIKIELYPTKNQIIYLNKMFGCIRFVYNKCLDKKIKAYEEDKENLNKNDICHYFHGDLRCEFDWLREIHTHPLKQTINQLFVSYKNFFQHGFGFPKFKAKSNEQSALFPKTAISVNTFDEENCKLNLIQDLKGLKFDCSDRDKVYLFKNKDKIRSITLKKRPSGKFHASILIDGDIQRTPPKPKNEFIAGDTGIKTFLTLSNQEIFENQHFYKRTEKKIAKLQRQLSKKVKGSSNYHKTRIKIAKSYEIMKNQKSNYLHNISTKIVIENQVIIMEDLSVKNMLKNHKLAKAIQEVGIGEFVRQLEYKCR